MIGYIKNKLKKKKYPYNSRLISGFKSEHKKLVSLVMDIKSAIDEDNFTTVNQLLKKLRMDILGHFMQEDFHLYRYLKYHYKDDKETISLILEFETSIKEIQKDVLKFLDTYTKYEARYDSSFKTKFIAVVDALSNRIEAEETSLYTLYLKQ